MMTTKQILKCIPLLLLVFLFTSCEEENTYNGITGTVENLPQLSGNYEYAAWIVESGSSRFMGIVNPDADGTAFMAFAPLPDQIRDASSIIVSIENSTDNYLEPSATQILVSNFSGSDQATLTSSAIGTDFAGIAGTCILDSPTTTSMSTDNTGIWFVDQDINQGLQLVALPAGWKYEGWVMFNETPVSTGRFSDPGMADEANPYSASEDPYLFPGEDFNTNAPAGINFPQNLAGKLTKITIEPEPDFSALPYDVSILQATIPNPSVTKTNITMEATLENLPTGTVTKEKE